MRAIQSALIAAIVALASTAPAVAQSACGRTENPDPGESLEQLAERCGTTIDQLMQANPNLDGQDVDPGVRLTMPVSDDDRDWLDRARKEVKEAGDTINNAATAAGRSASEYLSSQPDLNRDLLEFGERLGLPGVSSPPESGPTLDATKTDNPQEFMLSAAGLPGGAEVTITSEAEGSAPKTVWTGSTDQTGRIQAVVSLADQTDPREVVRFVARTSDGRVQLASDKLTVSAQ